MNPFNDGRHGNATFGVRLRIKEDLRMTDVLLVRFTQIRPRQIVKITVLQQNASALVINIQKRLQIRKLIRSSDFPW